VTPETHASLRQKILEEALGLVSREGPHGITMRALAQRLGYSPATIYLYFRNKEDLFQEIARHAAARLMLATDPCLGMPDAAAARDAFARALIDFALTHPHLYQILLTVDMTPYLADRNLEAPGRRLIDRYRDLYARGASEGSLRSRNPEHDVIVDWSLLHGFISHVHAGLFPPPRLPDATVEDLRELVLDSISSRTAVSPNQ
jgi:AcrR family transcriptional regulator